MNKNLKNKIVEISKELPKGIAVGVGSKIKNGKYTHEECISFFVERKKPIEELSAEEKIPPFLTIDGVRYKTDIVETGKIRPLLAPCYPSIPGSCPSCDQNTPVPCYQSWCPDDFDPNDVYKQYPKYFPNQAYREILCGGIQVTSAQNYPGVGTMGFIAIDNITGCLVGVTNNHVVVKNAFYTSQRDVDNVENESDDSVYQPVIGNNYYVGKVMRYVPFSISTTDNVDATIFSVNSSRISTSESWKQLESILDGETYQTVLFGPNIMPFASSGEINSITSSTPVSSYGRSTNSKQGVICGLSVTSNDLMGYTVVDYENGQYLMDVTFDHVIYFTRIDPDCPYPIYRGDSGSVLIADFSGTWKIIGLCFAGSTYGGGACRIDQIAAKLNISEWDGNVAPFIDVDSVEIKTVVGQSSSKTIVCDGETYWQIGAGTYSNPC